jgi:hypothetical protein
MQSVTNSIDSVKPLDFDLQKFLANAENGSQCKPDKDDGTSDSDDYRLLGKL